MGNFRFILVDDKAYSFGRQEKLPRGFHLAHSASFIIVLYHELRLNSTGTWDKAFFNPPPPPAYEDHVHAQKQRETYWVNSIDAFILVRWHRKRSPGTDMGIPVSVTGGFRAIFFVLSTMSQWLVVQHTILYKYLKRARLLVE